MFPATNSCDIPPPQVDFSAPPPYDVAANSKLPTYEEVQREKQMEGDGPVQVINITIVCTASLSYRLFTIRNIQKRCIKKL